MRTTTARLGRENIWARASDLFDHAPSAQALRWHRVLLLAGSLWREEGREVPLELSDLARAAAIRTVCAPVLLKRACTAYDGTLMLMKGPEVAARYPDPSARYFHDLDLLADDPDAAQQALIRAGFVGLETPHDFAGDAHLCPVAWPGLPLIVEIHRRPKSPPYLASASSDELFALAVPSATGIDGLVAPTRAAHAVLLAAHAWTHQPLGRLSDLIDVVAMLPTEERLEADAFAQRWGWERMWRTTISAADALLNGGPLVPALRTWARHLVEVRELSVLENRVARMTAPVVAMPPARAPRAVAWALRDSFGPTPDDPWMIARLRRGMLSLRHPFESKSQYDRRLGRSPWGR